MEKHGAKHKSWSKEIEVLVGNKSRSVSADRLLVGGRGPVKNKPMSLPNGTIVAPASVETASSVWECFTDSSLDGGKTWIRSSPPYIDRTDIPGEGAIQPSLILSGQTLTMLTRSSSGFVLRADSKDKGRT